MARFNQSTKSQTKTTNRAGGVAYEQSDKLKLASILLTSFLKNQFYRNAKTTTKEIVDLAHKVEPLFAAKAAVYARNVFGMRSVSHVVAGELTAPLSGQEYAKRFYEKVIFRPDDVTEILSYVKGNVSHAMRKGFRKALERFDDYQIAKYKGNGKNIKLVDAVNIVHAHSPSISRLVSGELKPAETWETKLSKAGTSDNKDEAKAEVWHELLRERKIGYTALVRNLRNISTQAPELIDVACELLRDEKLIKKSKIFPFQLLTAYNEMTDRKLLAALSDAIDLSCQNCPKFEGDTLIAVDMSGSMGGKPREIASLFAAVMYKAMNARILMFDSQSEEYIANPLDSVMTIAKNMPFRGGGTAFSAIFNGLNGTKFDRIFILSDMQSWGERYYWGGNVKELFNEYRRKVNPETKLYSFDLQGYGDMQFPEQNVFCVAGWSDKVFDVIEKLESGKSLVKQIEEVVL